MSPELETLDQLFGGDLPLSVVRGFYPDDGSFMQGIHGLLKSGDVRLATQEGVEVPSWQWRELFVDGTVLQAMPTLRIDLTQHGARRIS